MAQAQTLLISRLSAIGDVAMAVPLLKAALEKYPELQLVVLTRPFLHDLFLELPRTQMAQLELKGRHQGFWGIKRLANELDEQFELDGMVDLHDVLRTKVLRQWLGLKGIPTFHIQKDRSSRKKLTRRRDKIRKPATHSFALYAEALARAGFPVEVSPSEAPTLSFQRHSLPLDLTYLSRPYVGLAPFASRPLKMYPLDRIQQLALSIAEQGGTIFLFGGPEDQAWLTKLANFHASILVAPIHPLAQEMALIEQLDLMVSPDSANGHLARLVNTPVLTIWGPTHPDAGFHPLGPTTKRMDFQIPEKDLPCRPCFVVKAKPCYRGDHACMKRLQVEALKARVEDILKGA